MQYEMIYYLQTNIICLVILGMMLLIQRRYNKTNSTENKILCNMIVMTCIYCLSDIFAWALRGADNSFLVGLCIVADIVYIAVPAAICYEWFEYVYFKMEAKDFSRITIGKVMKSLFYLLILAVVSTPITHFAFYFDENHIYHRGPGAYLCPIVCVVLLISTCVWVIRYVNNEKHRSMKEEILRILFFPVPIIFCAVLQLVIYGLTLAQVGVCLSIILVFVSLQIEKISVDELTGINNRRELKLYLNGVMQSSNTESVFLCMIDVDFFKTINDTYGHVEGDTALKLVSSTIKRVGGMHKRRLFLARYGGDEFVIAGVNRTEEEMEIIAKQLKDAIAQTNEEVQKPYKLTLSVGYHLAKRGELSSVEELLKRADERMYDVKKKRVR